MHRKLVPLLLAAFMTILLPLAAHAEGGVGIGYWERIAHVINAMDTGGDNEVVAQIEPGETLPASILRVLQGREVTLVILRDGKRLRINGTQMYAVPDNQLFYTFEDLEALYKNPPGPGQAASQPAQEPEQPEEPPASSSPRADAPEAIVSQELPPRASSSEPASTPASVPERISLTSSQEEEYLPVSARTKIRRPLYPLLIAGGVIVAAAAGGGSAVYFGVLRDRKAPDEEDGQDAEPAPEQAPSPKG